jgi:hypothetical protein
MMKAWDKKVSQILGWSVAEFDPYHRWLGIPAEEQPPNWYRLLGLQPFESDPDVIATAADRQMAHVRTFQSGQNSQQSQRLLNEISSARVSLLNPARKAAYDQELARILDPEQANAETFAKIVGDARPASAPPTTSRRSFLPSILLGLALGLLVVASMFAMVFWHGEDDSSPIAAPPAAKLDSTATKPLPGVKPLPLPILPQQLQDVRQADPPGTDEANITNPHLESPKSFTDVGPTIAEARRLLSSRNATAALTSLKALPKENVSPEQLSQAARLTRIAELVQRFWTSAAAAVQELSSGDELQAGETLYHVDQVDSGGISVTVDGKHWRYNIDNLPFDFAFKLVSQRLPGTAQSLAVLASLQMVDSRGNKDVARQLWRTARQKGFSDEELAAEVDADWPRDVVVPPGAAIQVTPDVPEIVGAVDSADMREPVPDAEQLAAARLTVEKSLGSEFSRAKKPAEKAKLAQRLLQLLPDAQSSVEKFAVLSLARSLAKDGGDITLVRTSIEKLHAGFRGEIALSAADDLEALVGSESLNQSQKQELADLIASELSHAIYERHYSAADKLTGMAIAAAKKGDASARVKELTQFKKDISKVWEVERAARAARERLLSNPTDPEANLTLGNYLSVLLGNWSSGLPLLRQSSGELQSLAEQEVAYTAGGESALAIATRWSDYAKTQKGLAAVGALRHAIEWQVRGISQLSGIEQANGRLQLKELTERLPDDQRKLLATGAETPASTQAYLADLKVQNAVELVGRFKTEAKNFGGNEFPHAVEVLLSPGETGKLVYELGGRYDRCRVTFLRPDMLDTDPVAVCKFICDGKQSGDVAIAKSAIRADLRIPNVKQVQFQFEMAAATAATEPGKLPIVLLDGLFSKGEVAEPTATPTAKPPGTETEDLHVLTELDPRSKKVASEVALDLRKNHAVYRDGKEVGSYKRTGDRLTLTFQKSDAPPLALHVSGKTKGTFVGVTEHQGKSTSWKLERVSVVAIWRHFSGTNQGKDLTFYSNGRIGDPTGPMSYELNGNQLTLNLGSTVVEQVVISPDEKTYQGRNAQGLVLAGQRIK